MASIYNIQQNLLDIFNQIEENCGEITPELEEQLNMSKDEFEDKIKSYTCVIHQLESDLCAIKEEKDRLDSIKKSKEKTIESLKRIMVEAIQLFGNWIKWLLFTIITLGIYSFWIQIAIKKWKTEHTYFLN